MRKIVDIENPKVREWGQKNGVRISVLEMVQLVPTTSTPLQEFYLETKGIIPRKAYIPASKEEKLIQWLKLTQELFFPGL
jgi:hypothetical protein